MTFPTSVRPRRAARSPIFRASRFSGPKTAAAAACRTLLVLLVAACGGGAGSAPAASPDASAGAEEGVRSYPPNEISRSEIVERGTNAQDAMQLIRRLRPAWVRSRGSNSFTAPGAMYPVVYVDNIRRPGGLSALYSIPSSMIQGMEFIGPADATTRWGTGHQAGVIRVVTGR